MAVSTFKTVQSFVRFLWSWYVGGGKLLDQAIANERAAICVQCHNNKPSHETRGGCSVCNKMGGAVLQSVRAQIIKKNATPSDAKLLTCAICGCDNRITVWIPNQILLKLEDANAYPDFCFKKKIQENLEV